MARGRSSSERKLEILLKKNGQSHLLRFWDELNDTEKDTLVSDLKKIDFELFKKFFDQENTGAGRDIDLPPIIEIPKQPAQKRNEKEAFDAGCRMIGESKLAVFTAAGGQSSRLGLDFPNYAEALRAVLREDPDVIMVGEMRDAETVHATIKAAETGHLVLTSLHTATAPWTFSRILNFFKESEHDAIRLNLSYNLIAIMNQMLLPTEKKEVGLIPATEVFINTPGVRQYLREEEKESQLADVLKSGEDEMHNFNMSLARLVKEGYIGMTAAKAYSRNSQELEMLIKIRGSR